MRTEIDVTVEWAGSRTMKAWRELLPMLLDSYSKMYGDASEAQSISVGIFQAPKGRLLTVRAGDLLVGMGGWAWVRYLGEGYPESWLPDTAEVKRVFIREEFRGRGLGKLLNEEIIEDARAHDVGRLVAETGEPQVAAVALYTSLGYTADYRPFGKIETSATSHFFGMKL